jgi:hypothetical protein
VGMWIDFTILAFLSLGFWAVFQRVNLKIDKLIDKQTLIDKKIYEIIEELKKNHDVVFKIERRQADLMKKLLPSDEQILSDALIKGIQDISKKED